MEDEGWVAGRAGTLQAQAARGVEWFEQIDVGGHRKKALLLVLLEFWCYIFGYSSSTTKSFSVWMAFLRFYSWVEAPLNFFVEVGPTTFPLVCRRQEEERRIRRKGGPE